MPKRPGPPDWSIIMGLNATHLLLLLVVVVLLFGRGKISELMGDLAKGIKSFKKGMSEDETAPAPGATKTIDQSGRPIETSTDRTKTS
jgi:sec-independent protein translocase protein TatA